MEFYSVDDLKSLKCKKEKERRQKENDLLDRLKLFLLQNEPACSGSKMEKIDVMRHAIDFCNNSLAERKFLIWQNQLLLQQNASLIAKQKLLVDVCLPKPVDPFSPPPPPLLPRTDSMPQSPDSSLSSPQSSVSEDMKPIDNPPKTTKTWRPYL